VGLILPVVLLGLMASLSPTTIVVFILLLATARARVNAVAFLIGWGISLTVVFAGSYALGTSNAAQHGNGRQAVEVVEILLGLALIGVSAHQWRRRHAPRTSSEGARRFADRLHDLSPGSAAVVGVLKQPWAITAAAGVAVVRHQTGPLATLLAFACFTLVSTATVGLMLWYYARSPGEAETRLAALRVSMVKIGPTVFAVAGLAVGAFFTIEGILGVMD
jgi:hypothetical protein